MKKKNIIIVLALLIVAAALGAGITYSIMNKDSTIEFCGSYSMAGESAGSKNVLSLSVIDEKNETDGNYKIYNDNKLIQSGKYIISGDKKSVTLYKDDKPCGMIDFNGGKYYYIDLSFSMYEITKISDSQIVFGDTD